MDSFRELGRMLLLLGGLLIVTGAFFYFGGKLPLRQGRLPGDIVVERGNTRLYFPIVTCIVISIVISVVTWLVRSVTR